MHYGFVTDLGKPDFISDINRGPFSYERIISRESDT